MCVTKPSGTSPTPPANQSLLELMDAARLIETAAYDLADKVPSETVSKLIVSAAEIEKIIQEISRHNARRRFD